MGLLDLGPIEEPAGFEAPANVSFLGEQRDIFEVPEIAQTQVPLGHIVSLDLAGDEAVSVVPRTDADVAAEQARDFVGGVAAAGMQLDDGSGFNPKRIAERASQALGNAAQKKRGL